MSFPTQTILLLYEPSVKIMVHLQVPSCHLSRSNSHPQLVLRFLFCTCSCALTTHRNLPAPNSAPSTLTPHQTSKPLFGLREQNRDSSIFHCLQTQFCIFPNISVSIVCFRTIKPVSASKKAALQPKALNYPELLFCKTN